MYKVITSLWSKPILLNKTHLSTNLSIDEDSWVFVSDTVRDTSSMKNKNLMTNSWIASPPLIKNDESAINVHHFNPIENLLIEHASMSVYEQIASKTRNKRQKNIVNERKLDEQTEEVEDEEDDDDDDDDRTSMNYQHSNVTSIHNRNLNSSITTLETSSSSLVAHHRHLHRLHQRRKRSNKPSSKLILTNSIDDSKQLSNKTIERQRLNPTRTPKSLLQPPSHFNQ